MSVRVQVLYFAVLRDAAERSEEWLTMDPASGRALVADVSAAVAAAHPELRARLDSVRFAVNEAFASLDDPVLDGDVVALIPPVSGG